MQLSTAFKVLGDDTRLRILGLISKRELCVCQIGEALKISQPSASKHLIKLSYAGIITCTKISQWCFYRIKESFKEKYGGLYAFLLIQWQADAQYLKDLESLQAVIESNLCCQQVLAKNKKQ